MFGEDSFKGLHDVVQKRAVALLACCPERVGGLPKFFEPRHTGVEAQCSLGLPRAGVGALGHHKLHTASTDVHNEHPFQGFGQGLGHAAKNPIRLLFPADDAQVPAELTAHRFSECCAVGGVAQGTGSHHTDVLYVVIAQGLVKRPQRVEPTCKPVRTDGTVLEAALTDEDRLPKHVLAFPRVATPLRDQHREHVGAAVDYRGALGWGRGLSHGGPSGTTPER